MTSAPTLTSTPLDRTDAFGSALHVGDTVTALFRGPELSAALVTARVVGRDVAGVQLDPLRAGTTLLDCTPVAPGHLLSCAPERLVRIDRPARVGDPFSDWDSIGHFDATDEMLADGDTVAVALGGGYLGEYSWGRGVITGCTETMLWVVSDADYDTSVFDRFVLAGEQLRIWSPRAVRVGTPA
ncbi:hypothetical protein [Kocuria arenosa]|uniref:hypothetical protein n=1 Tax=Kocuria arenosa TaxID=3071446 RepID=UPI0034D39CE3